MSGVTTPELQNAVTIDSLVGNNGDGTVIINIARLAALLNAYIGPAYQTRAELYADLAWPAGALAQVYGDTTAAYIGTYRKAGNSGSGSWSRIGDLPASALGTAALEDEAAARQQADAALTASISNRIKGFSARATAIAAGQTALPENLGLILTCEGDSIAFRTPDMATDDPLFPTAPRWGVVLRMPSQNVIDALPVGRDATDAIVKLTTADGSVLVQIDGQGDLYLPGLDGQSVQRIMRAQLQAISDVNDRVQHAPSPALLRLTDSQGAAYGWVDQLGDMYLPGMDGMSVQRRMRQMMARLDEDAGGGSSGRQGSAEGMLVDVVDDLGCDRNFGEEVATRINAFTALVEARRGRATVYFPAGDYKIVESIVPRNGITFMGAGWNRAVIRPVASQSAFHRIAVSNPVEYCNFLGLHIDGSEQTLLNGTQYNVFTKGISLVGNRYCHFIGNYIHDTGATSLAPDFALNAWVLQNRIERSGRLGTVGIKGSSGIGIGVGLWQEEPCLIAQNQIKGARNYGIFLERQNNHSQYTACRGYIIDSNDCSGNNYGIGDCGCGELMITNNRAHGNTEAGISINRGTINVEPGERTFISGNQLLRNRDGIRYGPASDTSNLDEGFTSQSNLIEANSRDGIRIDSSAYAGSIDAFASMGDTIRRNGGHAVNLLAGSSVKNFDVTNGRLIENAGAAIQLDGSVNGGSISGNRIRDMRAVRAQTAAIAGTGALTDVDIDANQYVGPGPAVNLTGAQTRVTYGRNQGV